MRWLLFAALFAANAAHADLYRWIDPQSRSVKYSNVPPPWYGDAERERRGPRVEVIPAQRTAPAAQTAPAAAQGAPAAAARAATEKPDAPSDLASRWRDLLEDLASLGKGDFQNAGIGVRQQLDAYETVRAELDRQDPAGAARRRKEDGSVLDQVRRGLSGGLLAPPTAQKK